MSKRGPELIRRRESSSGQETFEEASTVVDRQAAQVRALKAAALIDIAIEHRQHGPRRQSDASRRMRRPGKNQATVAGVHVAVKHGHPVAARIGRRFRGRLRGSGPEKTSAPFLYTLPSSDRQPIARRRDGHAARLVAGAREKREPFLYTLPSSTATQPRLEPRRSDRPHRVVDRLNEVETHSLFQSRASFCPREAWLPELVFWPLSMGSLSWRSLSFDVIDFEYLSDRPD